MLSRAVLASRSLVSAAVVSRPSMVRAFSSVPAGCPGAISGPVCYEDDIAHVQVGTPFNIVELNKRFYR